MSGHTDGGAFGSGGMDAADIADCASGFTRLTASPLIGYLSCLIIQEVV